MFLKRLYSLKFIIVIIGKLVFEKKSKQNICDEIKLIN